MNNATETTNVNQPQPTAQDDLGCAAEFFKTAKVQFAREGRQSRDLSAAISIVRNSVKEKMTNSPCAGKVSDSVENALSMAALLKFEEGLPMKPRPSFETKDVIGDVIFNHKEQTTMFAVWSKAGGKVRFHRIYPIDPEDENKGYYVPPSDPFDSIEKKVVTVPTGVRSYGTTAHLVEKMKKFIRDYYEAPEEWIEIMVYFALMTWVPERLGDVPYLHLLGEMDTGKTRALKVVAVLCFRPTSIGGTSSTPTMFRLIDKWRGTLVIDEADFRDKTEMWDEVAKILNQGYTRYLPVMRSDGRDNEPRPFDVFGPKILSTRKPFADGATESRCITFPTSEMTVPLEIPLSLYEQFYNRAQELQNELLQWRIDNLARIRVEKHEQEIRKQHGTRSAQIGASLLSVVEDAAARQRIIESLAKEGAREKRNRQQMIVLEALERIDDIDVHDDDENPKLDDCHLREDGILLVKDVRCFANRAAKDFAVVDENSQKSYLTTQETAGILRSLGFLPNQKTRTKRGVEVNIDSALLQEKLKKYRGTKD